MTRGEVQEQAIRALAKGLTEAGIMGVEYDDQRIIYRTGGYKVIIEPKVHLNTMKNKP